MFSEAELKHRRPVWEALSELYLDTDTTLFEEAIVSKLAASPYSIGELEEILLREVHLVCVWNVFAWEWMGFDPQWLEDKIIKKRSSRLRYLYWAWSPLSRIILRTSRQWARICRRVNEVRASIINPQN